MSDQDAYTQGRIVELGSFKNIYIAQTYTGIHDPLRTETVHVSDSIVELCCQKGLSPFASIRAHPDMATYKGVAIREIWLALERQLAASHLLVAIYAGRSDGLTFALVGACRFVVPVVLLIHTKVTQHEVAYLPAIQSLAIIRYKIASDAVSQLESVLDSNYKHLNDTATFLDKLRNRNIELGRTVRFLRNDRGWSLRELAKRSHIHIDELYDIEERPLTSNASTSEISALAMAFDVEESTLFQPCEALIMHERASKIAKLARCLGMTVDEAMEFSLSEKTQQTRTRSRNVSEQELKIEMSRWLRSYRIIKSST